MKFVYLAILVFCFCNSYAKNYYVSSRTGNSRFNGLTPGKPKKNIQEAATLTKPGDTVFVMNGNYVSSCAACSVVDVIKSGKKNKYIVYTNYPGQHPVISFSGWAGFSITNGVSYIEIRGFEIIGNNAKIKLADALKQPQSCANKSGQVDPKYNGNGISIDGRSKKHPHHIVIADNIVHDCSGGGIGASQCDYITVESNTIYNTSLYTIFGTSAIAFYQFWNSDNAKGYHNVIRGNKCYNNRTLVPWIKDCQLEDGNGIIIDDFRSRQNGSKLGPYKNRTLIENNICWFNGGTGIHAFQSDHIDIINNTAYCNSQTKSLNSGQILAGLGDDMKIVNNIMVADSENVINTNYRNGRIMYENNLHYNITYPDKAVVALTSTSCLTNVNPLFVNAANSLKANFKLQKNSPALRRGKNNIYSIKDFEGNTRAQGHAPDIGAYENN